MELFDGLIKVKKVCESQISCARCPVKSGFGSCCFADAPVSWKSKELKRYIKNIEACQLHVDWSQVKVDTPILVWNEEGETKRKRYFAKYENDIVYAWLDGRTSWNANGNIHDWRYGELAEVEND